jgi:hypothetical protein
MDVATEGLILAPIYTLTLQLKRDAMHSMNCLPCVLVSGVPPWVVDADECSCPAAPEMESVYVIILMHLFKWHCPRYDASFLFLRELIRFRVINSEMPVMIF